MNATLRERSEGVRPVRNVIYIIGLIVVVIAVLSLAGII